MAREATLRGAGSNASGPLVATWQMLEWIRDNGPADRETIKDNCAKFVDPGYARRWYQSRRTKPSNVKRGITPERRGSAPADQLGHIDARTAQRAVIGNLLTDCAKHGTLTRDGVIFTFARMPRHAGGKMKTPAGMTVEQVTSDPHTQRRHVYEVELVKQLRAADKRGAFEHGATAPRLLKKELTALLNWLSTFDARGVPLETGPELDAIVALRGLRDRATDNPTTVKQTTAEKDAIRALWLSLDNFAQ